MFNKIGPFMAVLMVCMIFLALLPSGANAVTTGNGALVYQPGASASYDGAGSTYARIICLKNNGSYNGTLLCTFDQLKNVTVTMPNGTQVSKQVYPIYRSTDNGATWSLIANVFDREYNLLRTSQPCLYEVPQQVGNLAAGTILLAGNIFDDNPATVSRIVIYKSTDRGATWSFLSQVDQGGPCVYDPSPTSTTTTVWEPFLGLDSSGNLVCYYSDERQKSANILQAVVLKKSTDGGQTWGSVVNVAAIPNKSDRPGMITVAKLPNGKYMATYEVVNRPSQSLNTAVAYYKLSNDGVTWTANDLGTQIKLSDGRGIGSSPYVKWVPTGGPNGTVIVSSKWGLDSAGNISGGQNFYVNYNLGLGSWERMPYAVTYDYNDSVGGSFSGFSQSFDTSVDNLTIYHATNAENRSNPKTVNGTTYYLNDVRVGTRPMNANRYEAENATLTNVQVGNFIDASGGKEVQYINYSDSSVRFANVKVPTAGTYTVNVRYANGSGATSSHRVSVNGGTAFNVNYPAAVNWDRYLWASFTCTLNAGYNTIQFNYNSGYAELDCIEVYRAGAVNNDDFKLVNRNSGKYLEIYQASTADGGTVDQWGNTGHLCQNWYFVSAGSGYFKIVNTHSGKNLEIYQASTADGALADQWTDNGNYCQQWSLSPTDSGFGRIINRNSGKYLEVYQASTADGAAVDQWGNTNNNCQQWRLVKEGIE